MHHLKTRMYMLYIDIHVSNLVKGSHVQRVHMYKESTEVNEYGKGNSSRLTMITIFVDLQKTGDCLVHRYLI